LTEALEIRICHIRHKVAGTDDRRALGGPINPMGQHSISRSIRTLALASALASSPFLEFAIDRSGSGN
jgi:hypothetical protein